MHVRSCRRVTEPKTAPSDHLYSSGSPSPDQASIPVVTRTGMYWSAEESGEARRRLLSFWLALARERHRSRHHRGSPQGDFVSHRSSSSMYTGPVYECLEPRRNGQGSAHSSGPERRSSEVAFRRASAAGASNSRSSQRSISSCAPRPAAIRGVEMSTGSLRFGAHAASTWGLSRARDQNLIGRQSSHQRPRTARGIREVRSDCLDGIWPGRAFPRHPHSIPIVGGLRPAARVPSGRSTPKLFSRSADELPPKS